MMGVLVGVFAISWFAIPSPVPARPLPVRAEAPADVTDVVIPAAWANDAAIELATTDLRSALAEMYSMPARLVASDAPELPPYAMVLLAPGVPFFTQLINDGILQPENLPEDGYRVRKLNFRGQPMITIIGGSIRGTAYGAFRLEEMLRLDPEDIRRPMDVRVEPAMTLRIVSSPTGENFPSPEQALRWGYNTVAITQWPWLVTLDSVDPAIAGPPGSEERKWVQENRDRARVEIRKAKALHLNVLTSGDVISFPSRVYDLYKGLVGPVSTNPVYCLNNKFTQTLYRASLREVLTDFPDIDIVMLRTGENYPAGPVQGNPPAQKECGPDGNDMVAMTRLTMDISYQEIVGTFGKTYIQRAWDIGADGFHANPAVSDQILNGFAGRPNLIISYKHTQTDFWRYNPPNPNLLRTNVNRMVEYQAAREYEGKGAFPNYLGDLVANGAPEVAGDGSLKTLVDSGVKAVWVWARGGGWNGPYLKTDVWLDANNYALSHLIWEPRTPSKLLATEWATLLFGPRAAPHIVRVLELSQDAVLKSFYVAPFARSQGPWAPNVAWTRDDVIYGGDRVGALYQQSKSPADFAEALGEKETARQLVKEMGLEMSRAADLSVNPDLADAAINTTRYGDALISMMSDYVSGMFLYYRWVDGGRSDDSGRQQALKFLQSWQQDWANYNNQVLWLYGVASGFIDHGMVATVTEALADLQAPR